mmetsp:Transcript_123313/g.343416  ORF Transcript_123313/g.343416 Transcript_123313/m.343416 type:complete len:226 (-) Transcript_123313:271-948(-)
MLVLGALHHFHDQLSRLLDSFGRPRDLDLTRVGSLVACVDLKGATFLPDFDDGLCLLADDLTEERLWHRYKLLHRGLQEDGNVLGRGVLPLPLSGLDGPAVSFVAAATAGLLAPDTSCTTAILVLRRRGPGSVGAHLRVGPRPHWTPRHSAWPARHRRPHVALPTALPDLLPPVRPPRTRAGGGGGGGTPPLLLFFSASSCRHLCASSPPARRSHRSHSPTTQPG